METSDFEHNMNWMAKRLRVSVEDIENAIEALCTQGILKKEGESFKRIYHDGVRTTTDIPSEKIRKHHQEKLREASQLIDDIPIDMRDYTTHTFAINLERLPEAKRIIQEFRRRLVDLLEEGDQTEVYDLNIQLLPKSVITKESGESRQTIDQ